MLCTKSCFISGEASLISLDIIVSRVSSIDAEDFFFPACHLWIAIWVSSEQNRSTRSSSTNDGYVPSDFKKSFIRSGRLLPIAQKYAVPRYFWTARLVLSIISLFRRTCLSFFSCSTFSFSISNSSTIFLILFLSMLLSFYLFAPLLGLSYTNQLTSNVDLQ